MLGDNVEHRFFLSLQEGCCDETQICEICKICDLRIGIVTILASFLCKNPFYVIIPRLNGLVYQTKEFLFKI